MPNLNDSLFKESKPIIYIWLVSWLVLWISLLNPFGLAGADANELGDSFGIVNSIVSAITLLLVWKAYMLQKRELSETSKALRWQEESMVLQRFENSLLGLISLSKSHLNDIFVANWPQTVTGNEALAFIIGHEWRIDHLDRFGNLNSFRKYLETLDFLYNQIQRLDTSDDEKSRYVELITSQIWEQEILVYTMICKANLPGYKQISWLFTPNTIEATRHRMNERNQRHEDDVKKMLDQF